MNGIAWPQGKLRFATKLLPNCFWGVRYVVEIIGGPDRDRTDDLFHAITGRSANPCIYKALVAPQAL